MHLVVESGLGIVDGFWGLVDGGVDVSLVDNQACLVREGRPLVDQPGSTPPVSCGPRRRWPSSGPTTPPSALPGWLSASSVAAIRARLAELGLRWR